MQLRVSDTGTGMDGATLSRIFEPFFTTKAKGKGTGLGLAMVHGAVEQSGGAVEVQSTVGAGTTLTIFLPRIIAPAVVRGASLPQEAPMGRGERVLVVEDEPQVRTTVKRLLSMHGYEVAEAADGDEGLAVFSGRRHEIDMVLTDLVMPRMGGLALGRAVRAMGDVPVLYMSGYSEEVASGKAHLPAELLLEKPFDRGVMLRRVRGALDAARDVRRQSAA